MERGKRSRKKAPTLKVPSAIVIGLTGGVASGKSTVAKCFEDEGFLVIDADEVARRLRRQGGKAHALIQRTFGTTDPAALREIIFKSQQKRKLLESILHPLIGEASRRRIELALKRQTLKPLYVIYEAALLVETRRYRGLDGLIVVEAPLQKRVERLCVRDSIDSDLALKMIRSQITDASRRLVATCVIRNSGSKTGLQQKVHKIAVEFRRRLPTINSKA